MLESCVLYFCVISARHLW